MNHADYLDSDRDLAFLTEMSLDNAYLGITNKPFDAPEWQSVIEDYLCYVDNN